MPQAGAAVTLDDEVCWPCDGTGRGGRLSKRDPGWCSGCGFFFDLYGQRTLEPWRTCKVHNPIRTSCLHSDSIMHPDH